MAGTWQGEDGEEGDVLGQPCPVDTVNITVKNSFRKPGRGMVNCLSESKEHL